MHTDKARLPQLEAEVARLREEVAGLRQKVDEILKIVESKIDESR